MNYRLYLDETGNPDLTNTHDERHRFFSLCGVILAHNLAGGDATSFMNATKAKFFHSDPDDPVIFHRKEIVNREGVFAVLKDPLLDAEFKRWLKRYLTIIQYKVICVVIDKRTMLGMTHWREKNPYHYCMQIIVEKYVQWLERNNCTGDVMSERRGGKEDKALEEQFSRVYSEGYGYVNPARIRNVLTASTLKMRRKKENITGLQLVDLIANPAYRYTRSLRDRNIRPAGFTQEIIELLVEEKFDRSASGKIDGYGTKYLP